MIALTNFIAAAAISMGGPELLGVDVVVVAEFLREAAGYGVPLRTDHLVHAFRPVEKFRVAVKLVIGVTAVQVGHEALGVTPVVGAVRAGVHLEQAAAAVAAAIAEQYSAVSQTPAGLALALAARSSNSADNVIFRIVRWAATCDECEWTSGYRSRPSGSPVKSRRNLPEGVVRRLRVTGR